MTELSSDLTARGGLKAYLAAGTSAVATAMAAGSADAAVITGGPNGIDLSGQAFLDLNGDSQYDFGIFRDLVDLDPAALKTDNGYTTRLEAGPGATGQGAFHATQGDQVFGGSGFTPPTFNVFANWSFSQNGGAIGPEEVLVGMTFNLGVGPLFGWIKFTPNGPDGTFIDSWAYNDTGAPILAGELFEDPPPPPPPGGVPGPHSLLLLAGGLAGIGAYRRKRQEAA